MYIYVYLHLHVYVPARLQRLFHAPLGTALCIPFSAGTFPPKKKHVARYLRASSFRANWGRKLQGKRTIETGKSSPCERARHDRPTKAMPTPSSLCKRACCRSTVATRHGGNVTCFDVTRLVVGRVKSCRRWSDATSGEVMRSVGRCHVMECHVK